MSERIWVSNLAGERHRVELVGAEALREWLAEASKRPPCLYDLFLPDSGGGLRFALGEGLAGSLLEALDDGDCFWLHEGDPALPEQELLDGDMPLPVPGEEQISLERLVEVLLYYVTHLERPPGRWFDARGRPEGPQTPLRGPPPRAIGPCSRALVAWLSSMPRRDVPLREVLDLVRLTHDPDLKAWLFATAHHTSVERLRLYDLWAQVPSAFGRDIQLGTLASGEPVLATRRGIVLVAPDGWHRRSFESFLSELAAQAEELSEPTSLDPWLGR